MPEIIREVNIKTFLSEFDIEWWNKNQFFIFEGAILNIKFSVPTRRTYYVIATVVVGEIEILVNLEPFKVTSNHFIFLSPTQILHVKSVTKDTIFKIIFFEQSFLIENDLHYLTNTSLFSPSARPVVAVAESEFEHLIPLISHIKINTQDFSRPNRSQVAKNLILSFLYELDAVIKNEETNLINKYSKNEGIAQQFNLLLHANFRKEHSVKFYADLLFITPKHLSEVIKKVTGKTAGELVDDILILEARVLLKNPDLAIQQIADMLHFADQFTFSKYFKRLTGIPPNSFRSIKE